ncbi:MAG: glycosyltransferase family 2 protein [Bacteroidetes bacterium]|nr:MAG: glycosyltransferase family 2 protein [Bacteroidota bacterium]
MVEKQVAVLLVLYNEERFICSLLSSIKEQSYKNICIYALDNNSNDNSFSLAKSILSESDIQKSEFNYGYAAGNNLLAKKAISAGAEYLFVLNTDMVLDKDCIKHLVNLIESDNYIGAVSPIVLFGENEEKTKLIQSYVDSADFKFCKTYSTHSGLELHDIRLQDKYQVNILHGGAMMIKRELYQLIGLFYDEYFMYQDEIDFAYRVKLTHYQLYVTKLAISWHFHDWSKRNISGYCRQYYYMNRNRILYLRRNKLSKHIFFEFIKEFLQVPFKILWAYKIANIKLFKYYYLGYIDGIMKKTGKFFFEFDQ